MALTKDDLQAIGTVVSTLIEKQVRPMVKEEIRVALIEQNKFIAKNFDGMKVLMEQTYVKREEFEELQNELDDLRKQVQELQRKLHTPS
jgi:polyhydroxyalkanoate synthesis regulator phasin